MTSKIPKTPHQKKAHSYAKEGRNAYGENDKASRKAIPKRKAHENRKSRRKARQALDNVEHLPEEAADLAESSLKNDIERVGGWKKEPDVPLGKHLQRK